VGALDGLTVFIIAPTASEAENVLAYYSGHYKHDSLNVQALSDYRGKFLYFAVAAPGSFPDSNAKLKNWIDALPAGFFVVADNAYMISEHVLIPFSGTQQHVPENSSYNYFLSQLRICVEQAFGQFSVKWRIIRKPLETSLKNSSLLLGTCARLHNFIIDNDWQGNHKKILLLLGTHIITIHHLGSCNATNMKLEVVRTFKSPFVSSTTWKTGCVIQKTCIFADFTTDGVHSRLTGRAYMSCISGSSETDAQFLCSTPVCFHRHGTKVFGIAA
jgi:hypothetical protein